MAWEDLAGKAIDKIHPGEYRYFWITAMGIIGMVALAFIRKVLFVPVTVTPEQMSNIVRGAVKEEMSGPEEHIKYLQEQITDLSKKFDQSQLLQQTQHSDSITRLTRLETMATRNVKRLD